MAYVVQNPSKTEQRGVIRFLTAEQTPPQEVYRRMCQVYGAACISRTRVFEWCRRFREGRQTLQDDSRPGQANLVITAANIASVDAIVKANRRVTEAVIVRETGISAGSIHTILREKLNYRKVSAVWVPKCLTDVHKETRLGHSLTHLTRYQLEGNEFLSRIVAGDESWCHHFEPETKRQSSQWKHPGSPPPHKAKASISERKVMLTFFFDCRGPLLVEFMTRGTTINANSYCETLHKLRTAIKRKRPGMLTDGVILLHDNARPHVAHQTTAELRRMRWEVLKHPPYSPDLSPCDFAIFGPLKKHLKGRRFKSDDEVQEVVSDWLTHQPTEFYARGIDALVPRWDACLNSQGGYFNVH